MPRGPRILLAVDLIARVARRIGEAIRRASGRSRGPDRAQRRRAPQPPPAGRRPRRVDQERDRLAAGAQAIVQQARDAGVHATYLIWEGDPAEAILEASRSEDADVIVLGSRRRTNLRRLILGSVSSEVSKRATCDVVVVPA